MSEEPGQASGGDDRSNGRPARANDARGGAPRRDSSPSAGRGGGATRGSYPGRGGVASGRSSPTDGGTRNDRRSAPVTGRDDSGGRAARSSDSRSGHSGAQGSDRPRSSGAGRSFGSDRGLRAEGASTGSWPRTEGPRSSGSAGGASRGGERGGRPVGDRAASGRPASNRGGVDRDRAPRVERLVRRVEAPEIPEEVLASELDPDARGRLRTLSKDNADDVARHLVMAGRLIDHDPELAYRHAQVALARGGRVDIVREAAAITAYATGRYAEALREFRTVVRLNGTTEHLPLMADCERGLGRPARVLELAASSEAASLIGDPKTELQIVVAGARADMGEYDAALHALDSIAGVGPDMIVRVAQAREQIIELRDPSAPTESERVVSSSEVLDLLDEEVIVYDLEDDTDE